MGWVKTKLDEETHDKLRQIVNESDHPTHEVTADMITHCVNKEMDLHRTKYVGGD